MKTTLIFGLAMLAVLGKVAVSESSVNDQRSDSLEMQLIPEEVLGFELLDGSLVEGRRLFFSDRLWCQACHAVLSEDRSSGPHLAGVGSRLDYHDLVMAILVPSAEFADGYKQVSVVTASGVTIVGVEIESSSDATYLVLQDREGHVHRLLRDELEAYEVADSEMPAGQIEAAELTPQELADLLAFLQSLREENE